MSIFNSKGIISIAALLTQGAIISFFSYFFGVLFLITTPAPKTPSLQLGTFTPISIVPDYPTEPPVTLPPLLTGSYCSKDNVKSDPTCTCVPTEEDVISCPKVNGLCPYPVSSMPPKFTQNHLNECYYTSPGTGFTALKNTANCREYCIGKPVIYLYPTRDTIVNVSLSVPGKIVESIPTYPIGGWQHILAHPDGSLMYQGTSYSELYYESSVNAVTPPLDGIIIPAPDIENQLDIITGKLGLLPKEQEEFTAYWVPKLKNLHMPYILFSVLSKTEKERIDTVTINPAPDTRIEFIAYFKGIRDAIIPDLIPLRLPATPQRKGFTEVEWGGTIDIH